MIYNLESLDDDFKLLPFYNGTPDRLQVVNKAKNRTAIWSDYLTPELISIINERYYFDFEYYDYERIQL